VDTAVDLRPKLSRVSRVHMGGPFPEPVSLVVPGLGVVRCSKILQVYERKRLTCLGLLDRHRNGGTQEDKVVVKLYFARMRAARQWRKGDRGFRVFMEGGVAAPAVLFSGYLPGHGVYAAVYEYLESAENLDEVLQRTSAERDRRPMLEALIEAVALQHASGVVQKDLRASNFMVRSGNVYAIDGDLVRGFTAPLDRETSLENLAWLLANNRAFFGDHVHDWYTLYCVKRGWEAEPREERRLTGEIFRVRRRNFKKTLRKVFSSRDVFVSRKERGLFVLHRRDRPWLGPKEILSLIEGLPAAKGERDGSLSRYEVRSNHGGLLVFCSAGFLFSGRRGFGKVGGLWRNAYMLRWLGIKAPSPLALVRSGVPMGRCVSWAVFECVEGVPLGSFLRSPGVSEREMSQVLPRLARTLSTLFRFGLGLERLRSDEIMVMDDAVALSALEAVRMAVRTEAAVRRLCSDFLTEWEDAPEVKSGIEASLRSEGLL